MISTILWLSLTLYHEGRNQEHLDQLAIAHTVLNRGGSVKATVLKPKQFSCFNAGVKFPKDLKAYFTSVGIAVEALKGNDFLQGATHYHEKSIRPYWRDRFTYVGRYGSHDFYKPLVKIKADKKKVYSGFALVRKSIWRGV